jgi:hypothetical protein
MHAEYFLIDEAGAVLSSGPGSNLTWNDGVWSGGSVGGRSVITLTGVMRAQDYSKSLRYGITLFVAVGAEILWSSGTISLADGTDIIVEGTLTIVANETAVFIGQAQLLGDVPNDSMDPDLLTMAPGRDWHDYFDLALSPELKYGWYENPLCGGQCLKTNELRIQGDGIVQTADRSNITFRVPLNLIGQSKLNIGKAVLITLASGGICGNDVVIDIGPGTQLELSGGQMKMQSTCTVQGAGELLVSAGAHDLSFSVDAHITIYGGAMIWPTSRGSTYTCCCVAVLLLAVVLVLVV